ncbi:single-stranded DNA-binding protein [Cellulomonas sp. Y8]|uniref:single-stranded DNA-binding protein n=1 Tax=Cellulomonas sp. Y8 TaxID=2591145 RepID=UPI0011CBEBFC|nr:single-stranded DNA-binding protein [Cellulomonas sp. Y8]
MKPGIAVDHLLTAALWSRSDAERIRAALPAWWAAAAGGLRPALAALIHDHDTHQAGDVDGHERAAAILAWILRRAGEVTEAAEQHQRWREAGRHGPEPAHWSRDMALAMHGPARGLPDPRLLTLAARVAPLAVELAAPDRHTTHSLAYLIATARTDPPTRGRSMLLTTTVTFEGNLAADPERRTSAETQRPYVDLVVLVNEPGEQVDEDGKSTRPEPTRHRVRVPGPAAEHAAACLRCGDRVVVTGRVVTDSWTDPETQRKRTAPRVIADAIGVSLRFTPVLVQRTTR